MTNTRCSRAFFAATSAIHAASHLTAGVLWGELVSVFAVGLPRLWVCPVSHSVEGVLSGRPVSEIVRTVIGGVAVPVPYLPTVRPWTEPSLGYECVDGAGQGLTINSERDLEVPRTASSWSQCAAGGANVSVVARLISWSRRNRPPLFCVHSYIVGAHEL